MSEQSKVTDGKVEMPSKEAREYDLKRIDNIPLSQEREVLIYLCIRLPKYIAALEHVEAERDAEREEVLYARDCIKSLRTQLTEAKQERDAKESIIQGMIESAAKLHAERDALRKENARLAGEVDLLNLELRI